MKHEQASRHLAMVAKHAVAGGLDAVAVLDSKGKPLVLAGDLGADEARAVAAFATHESELRSRLMKGDVLDTSLGDRKALVAISAKAVLLVMVLPRDPDKLQPRVVDRFRVQCDVIVARANEGSSDDGMLPPSSSGGGSSSGPAELPLIELGITVPRGRT